MSHSFSRVVTHTVWGTKHRQPFLIPMVADAVCAYVVGICEQLKIEVYACEAVYDHIHLVHTIPRTQTMADIMERIKTDSSKWINFTYDDIIGFRWQMGYGTFSVGYYTFDKTVAYVKNQRSKHLKQDKYRMYEEELLYLMELHGVDFDMKYFLK